MAAARGKTGAKKTVATQVPWNDARPATAVLISGPTDALAARAQETIKDRLREQSKNVEIHDVEAASYRSGELLTLASPSLFSEPRLIRVSGVEEANDAFITEAKSYLEQPDTETTVVFRHRGGQRGKGLLDVIRKSVGAIEITCADVTERERPAFIQSEFARLGAQISQSAVRMLAGAYTEDLSELAAVCEQLVRDSGTRITESHVEKLTEGRVETTAFKVADAACAGRAADALILLRHAVSTGAKPMQVLGAVNMKVRAMARVYGVRGPSGKLAGQLGMAPWQVERAQRETRGWSEDALARIIDIAAETEWLLKGGAAEPDYTLERYILTIARRGKTTI